MPGRSLRPAGVDSCGLRERVIEPVTGVLSRGANVGYACPQQRPTEILQPPCSPKQASGGRKARKSLQTPS